MRAGAVTFALMLLVFVVNTSFPRGNGRPDIADLFFDPESVITNPETIGGLVETRVIDAVEACLGGDAWPGTAIATPIDAGAGYGVTAAPAPDLWVDGAYVPVLRPGASRLESAIYGTLQEADTGACGAVGLEALRDAVAQVQELPYTIEELEADLMGDRRYRDALDRWRACMADAGHPFQSPEDIIASLAGEARGLRGDEARRLAAEELAIANADRGCREQTLDRAIEALAPEYGARFVDANRDALIAVAAPPLQGTARLDGLGTGDLQVSLLWEAPVDLDLSVRDPDGDVVWYDRPQVPSGGTLDRDANFPCTQIEDEPVENAFWPEGAAPPGVYTVTVSYRTSCGGGNAVSFRIVVRVNGSVVIDRTDRLGPGQSDTFDVEMSP